MIQYEIINGVGKITLNRPDKYHSFVREMALQLQKKLDNCNEEKEVRAILITATGKAFCAGQDLGEATDPNGPELTQIVQEHYNPIIRKIRNIEKLHSVLDLALNLPRDTDDRGGYIDSFADNKGDERISNYMCWLLEGYDRDLSRENNIKQANQLYAKAWGKDKIFKSTKTIKTPISVKP